jgi:hypothetical protein
MNQGTPTVRANSVGNRCSASADGWGSTTRPMRKPASERASTTDLSGRRQKCWVTSTPSLVQVSLTSSVSK